MKPSLPLLLLAAVVLASCAKKAEVPAGDGPFSAQATLSTNVVNVGDLARLRLEITHPAGGRVDVPDLNRGREIIVRSIQQPKREQSPSRAVIDLTLTSLVVSNHVVATNGLRFTYADGRVVTTSFPFVTLDVRSLLEGTNTAVREAKGLATWPDRARQRALIVAAIALAMAIIVGILLARRRRRARPPPPPPPPPPPHEVALAALRVLLGRQWIEQRVIEPFYVELSGIVRSYLENRFGLHAPEQTTDEFIREATSSRRLSLDHQQLVSAFLEQSDLVKFARHEPESTDMSNAAAAAERLIGETAARPGGTAP
jgi:hypothetical protein